MALDPYEDLQRGVPVRPALDEGNVPGTPSTKGIGIVIAALLIGAGFIYLGTSFAPSATAPQPLPRAGFHAGWCECQNPCDSDWHAVRQSWQPVL